VTDGQARAAPEVRSVQIVLPGHANPYSSLFGGTLLQWMDTTAAIAAMRFCQRSVLTASLESIDFRQPIHVGEMVEVVARAVYAGRTSVIVRVEVFREALAGDRDLCTSGYFSMVAVDSAGRPAPVPALLIEDEAAWREGEAIRARAAARRVARSV
jgi:acyl-CoA hydrolase